MSKQHGDETLGQTKAWSAELEKPSTYESGPHFRSLDVLAGICAFRAELKLSGITDIYIMFDDAKLLLSMPQQFGEPLEEHRSLKETTSYEKVGLFPAVYAQQLPLTPDRVKVSRKRNHDNINISYVGGSTEQNSLVD